MNLPQYSHCQPGLLLETVGDDREVFLQLVEIFMRESAEKCELLRLAAAAADFEQLGFQSHALKGTVGPLGARALVQMLLLMEDECGRKQCICDAERISMIDEELSHVRREMQQFIAHF
jgi:HPt (histidine-containing phosphotransfer) domain-containing protein